MKRSDFARVVSTFEDVVAIDDFVVLNKQVGKRGVLGTFQDHFRAGCGMEYVASDFYDRQGFQWMDKPNCY